MAAITGNAQAVGRGEGYVLPAWPRREIPSIGSLYASESSPPMISLTHSLLGLASGLLVGFSLGLVGGGGSILAVPLMVYVVGVPQPHIAMATSAIGVAA